MICRVTYIGGFGTKYSEKGNLGENPRKNNY